MSLRVRNYEGFNPISSVGIEYIKDNESFSIYLHNYQVCRISSGRDAVATFVSIEIFDTKLYSNNVEQINQIIALYQEL